LPPFASDPAAVAPLPIRSILPLAALAKKRAISGPPPAAENVAFERDAGCLLPRRCRLHRAGELCSKLSGGS
jgi:hypothetical protein